MSKNHCLKKEKIMKNSIIVVLFLLFHTNFYAQQQLQPVDYVQPLIGVINEGRCMPGPCLPHASVYPSPQTLNSYNGGYNVNEKIVGFAQLHAQGTSGLKPYGNFLLSPQLGLTLKETDRQSKKEVEFTSAYYYKVRLKKYRILCELIPEHNSALYKLTFPASDSAVVLLDIGRKNGGDLGIENGSISITPDGKAMYGGGVYGSNWPDNRHKWNMYFYAEFSKPATLRGVFEDKNILPEQLNGSSVKKGLGAYLGFKTKTNEEVYVKISASFISTEHAKQLLHSEISEWNFEALKEKARAKWNNYLSRIQIEGTEEEKTIFYTHMFHTFVQPRDRTGNNLWQTQEDFWDDHYTLWDSWKTLFPLMSIIDQKMVTSNINSFINRHKHNGYVAEAFVNGKESAIGQGGNTVDNVIGDAYVKKIPGIDWEKAYSLLKYNADSRRTKGYRELGYMYYKEPTSYSWRAKAGSSTIAFSVNDYCIATRWIQGSIATDL
jgi:predicted alpha-1,2-mannosidase